MRVSVTKSNGSLRVTLVADDEDDKHLIDMMKSKKCDKITIAAENELTFNLVQP